MNYQLLFLTVGSIYPKGQYAYRDPKDKRHFHPHCIHIHNFYLLIDFENKKIINNKDIKVVNLEKLNRIEDMLKNYLLYWDHLYINNNVLDGLDSKLIVKTDKEVINYVFKNDCPSNYKEFLNDLKEMV